MECLGTAPLTFSNLNIPEFQVKDTGRAETFVRSQRAFATVSPIGCPPLHETEPARNVSDKMANTEPVGSNAMQGGGFSSPVLKPRVDRISRAAISTNTDHDGHSRSKQDRTEKAGGEIVPDSGPANGCKVRITASVRASRKRPTSPDIEHVARLAERRDRKRVNRAIMKPLSVNSESEEKSLSEGEQEGKKAKRSGSTKKARKKKKPKIDSALALMQHFTATNIGKDRLTLKPGVSMGFFNKGKASPPVRMDHKKGKRKKDFTFSELRFLNNPGPPLPQVGTDSSTSTCSSSAGREDVPPKRSKFFTAGSPQRKARHKRQRRQKNHAESVPSPKKTVFNASDVKMDSSDDPQESVVWDIEMDKPLPSEGQSEGDLDSRGIVVLSTNPPGCDPPSQPDPSTVEKLEESPNRSNHGSSLSFDVPAVRLQSDILRRGTRSPSLAPSNSASQLAAVARSAHDLSSALTKRAGRDRYQKSRRLLDCQPCSPVPHKHQPFRFRPVHNLNMHEHPVSPAAEPLLFPSCFEYEPQGYLPQHICQRNHEDLFLYLDEDRPTDEYQVDGEILYGGDMQPYTLRAGGCYETFPEAYRPSNGFQAQDAIVDDGIFFEHYNDPTWDMSVDCLDNEISKHQHHEWGEELISGECISNVDVGQLLSGEIIDSENMEPHSLFDIELESTLSLPPRTDPEPGFLFTQGRSLLLEVEEPVLRDVAKFMEGGLEHAQAEVARRLKDHWIPQKL